ncbi:MAG: hypothetical protein QF464_16890 [Myxococcota bacterium]|nr:hypothetical protein [Myxococcota bacterium]
MSNGYQHVVTSLETRYDYQSARTLAGDALKVAGLEQAAEYKPAELQKIANAIGASGTDMDRVWLALGIAPKGTAMPAAPEPPPAEEAKADDAGDAKAEKAPAKKKAAKKKK